MNKKIFFVMIVFILALSVLVSAELVAQPSSGSTFSGDRAGSVSFVSSKYTASRDVKTYYSDRLSTYYPVLSDNADMCKARQDILILQVPPAGCQPAVVRSDLLAEQNVPVFCQLSALKINPLIDVKQVKNIRFTGNYPKGIAGVGFHPAKAALRTGSALLGSPLMNNIGYAVVVLNRNENESSLPDFVNVTLQASLEYDAEYALGIGKASFIVEPVNDEEWKSEKHKQSFLKGQFYLRAEELTPAYAVLSVYQGDRRIATQKVEKGKDSSEIFLPGYYCQVSVKLVYDGYFGGGNVARIQVDDDEFDVYVGSRFLNDKCVVEKIVFGEEKTTGGDKTGDKAEITGKYSLDKELSFASGSKVNILKDGKYTELYVVYGKKIITGTGSLEDSFFVASFDKNGDRKEVIADVERVIGTTDQVKIININSKNVPKEYSDFTQLNSQTISVAKPTEKTTSNEKTRTTGEVESVRIRCGSERFELNISAKSIVVGDKVKILDDKAGEEYEVVSIKDGKYNIKKVGSNDDPISKEAKELVPIGSNKLFEVKYDKEIEEGFSEAIKAYEKVADEYPLEKDNSQLQENEKIESFGEHALIEGIRLAKELNKEVSEAKLINKYLDLYANGVRANEYRNRFNELYKKDSSLAGYVIEIDNELRAIRLIDVYGKRNEPFAMFLVNPKDEKTKNKSESKEVKVEEVKTLLKKERVGVENGGALKHIKLEDIVDVDVVKARVYCEEITSSGGKSTKDEILYLKLSESVEVCQKSVVLKLTKIEEMEAGEVRIVPISKKTSSNTNVTIGVGIEKRAIQLSPDEIKDKIAVINESIKKWESINKRLGEVVKGLKGACFATAGVLTIKNFFSGISGESLAREKVMRGEGGWTEKCQQMVTKKEKGYTTLMQCYNGEKEEIKKDVEAYKKAISNVNGKIKEIEKDKDCVVKGSGFFGGESVNREKCGPKIIEEIKRKHGNKKIDTNGDGKIDDNDATIEKLFDKNSYTNGKVGYEELRDLYMNLEVQEDRSKSGVGEKISGDWANRIGSSIGDRIKLTKDIDSIQDKLKGTELEKFPVDVFGKKDAIVGEYYGGEIKKNDFGLNDNSIFPDDKTTRAAKVLSAGGSTYLILLQRVDGGRYSIDSTLNEQSKAIYKLKEKNGGYEVIKNNGNGILYNQFSKETDVAFKSFNKVDSQSYNNKYANAEVRFFETEPYKGMPAVVPLDENEGWYVGTKQTLPSFGGIRAFDASGRPVSFWLCNVGVDGREDFYIEGRDICRQFNLNTGQPIDYFPGLPKEKTRKLVEKAVRYLEEAARQYGSGKREIRIDGKRISVGNPAVNIPGQQCQDFMSPGECKLLFNVCDPVICPASRCDLGGAFPVSDVIQTGVIGGLVMCLPNAKEGIVMPFCLSGIHAGLEAWLTLLKSHSQCLQEQLNTGRVMGICDQLYSIYLCEFFWRQLAPVANIIIPKMIDRMYYGTRLKGGGEYLTTMDAWENMRESVRYFTQSYGVNTFEAFKLRSVAEAGTTFCRSFISMKAPKDIDVLLEPDSPPQFHAWFSTTRYSDATLPASAQYKVFYHISAGNDIGVAYAVYLKDPPDSSYYQSIPVISVASGFIGKGEFATESRDFTAPEGYQQLCVSINGKEECGFKQVTSSFALDYVRDKFVSEEISSKNIVGEKECIAGGNNPAAFLQLNPQAAVEEFALPENYNRGVSRICSTENPGLGSDPLRFVDVGYCGNEKVRCWLDKNSIKEALSSNVPLDAGVKNATLSKVEQEQIKKLKEEKGIITEDTSEFQPAIDKIISEREKLFKDNGKGKDKKNVISIVEKIEVLMDKLFFNHHKARVLYEEGNLWRDFVRKLRPVPEAKPAEKKAEAKKTEEVETGEENGEKKAEGAKPVEESEEKPAENGEKAVAENGEKEEETEALEPLVFTLKEGLLVDKKIYYSGKYFDVFIEGGEVFYDDFLWKRKNIGEIKNNVINLKKLNAILNSDAEKNDLSEDLIVKLKNVYDKLNNASIYSDGTIKKEK